MATTETVVTTRVQRSPEWLYLSGALLLLLLRQPRGMGPFPWLRLWRVRVVFRRRRWADPRLPIASQERPETKSGGRESLKMALHLPQLVICCC